MNPRLPSRLWPHLFALGVGLYFFNAFHFGKSWGLLEGAGVTAFQMAAAVLIDRRLRRDLWRRPGPAWPMAAVAGAVLAAVLAVWMTRRLSWSQPLIATLAAGGSRALSRFYAAAYRSRPRENHEEGIRWLVLLAGALFLIGPYATTRFVGAGDAVHYARQLADFLAQVRAWVFPVFVGQSLSAFGGDVHPLRTAPYFQYAGGLLDLLTGFSLNAISLQNLLIVLSFVAAVFTCYWTLAGIAGVRRWTLVWLALLFASSPGVLALIYGGDMVSAWLTLPWLPLLFSGWARTWREADPARGLARQAVALAMIWLANAPIAIWAALLTATNECIRLVVRERSRASGFISAGAAALCLLLCQYVFVSVATLDAPENPYLTHALKHGLITNVLKDSWAGPLRLVSAGGDRLLTDLHLSPGLWVAVLFGATGLRVRKWPVGTMTALLALLTFLLIPWGPFTGAFWSHLPSFVLTITEKWPEQRFYPLLSAMIPFLAAQGLACSPWYRGRAAIAATFALALGVGWSAREAMKFRNRGNSVMRTEEATGRLLFPENNQLSRYSYEMWGRLPRTFSFAHMDPLEQVRLLDKTGLNVVDSNILAVLRDQARVPAALQLRYIATENGGHFVPDIRLQPGQIRLLEFDFKKPGPGGVLQITGQRTHHEYQLPSASHCCPKQAEDGLIWG